MNGRERAVLALSNKLLNGDIEDGFSVRAIYRKNYKNLGRNAELIKEACEELEDLNWLRSHYTPASKQHSASTTYYINPAIRSGHIKTSTLTTATADSFPTVATLATGEQGPFVKSGGFLGEDHQNNPESLVANVASLGTESGDNPTVATLATGEQGSFVKSEGYSGHSDLETAASLVTGLGIESEDKPTVATLATDEQGPFEDTDDFFSENKTHLDSVQTTPYEEEYI